MRKWLRVAGIGIAWLRLAAPAPGAEAEALPLEAAIEQALAHNRELVRGALDLQGGRLALEQAQTAVRNVQLVPEGTAGAGSAGQEWRAGLRAEATGAYGTRVSAGAAARLVAVDAGADVRRGEVRVAVSQPLFRDFGPLVRNEPVAQASDSLLAARRAWERDRSALVVRVVELYEGLILLRHQIERDEAFAARMERLWALADARERQGRAARTEVLRMDLQRGEASARLEAERAQLEVQFKEFADLLGRNLDEEFRLTPPALLELEIPDAAAALAVALDERPDYAQALQDIETADRQLRLARRGLLPDVTLAATRSRFGEGADWSAAGDLDQEDWFAGLTADMNLDLRGARLAAARAGVDADSRRQMAEIVRSRLALEVDAALAAYRRTRTELDIAGRNRGLAANRAELARALFEAGRAGADPVSDAEADQIEAELKELAARRAASVAAYRLLHVLGTLMPVPPELLRTARK